jgi:hypothetical protein
MALSKKANVKEDSVDTIGFQLFSSEMSIGDDGNDLIASFLQKASKLIEKEINDAGGVGGKTLRIHYNHLPKGDTGVDQLLSYICSRADILFMNGHIASRLNQNIIDGLDLDSLIMLSYQLPSTVSSRPKEFHPNIFNVGRGAEQAKSASIKNILQQDSSNSSRVIFIHDGKRLANIESEFTKDYAGELISHNFSAFQTESEIKEQLAPILNEIGNDDIIILDVGLRVFQHIFTHLNETSKRPKVIKAFGSVEGRFQRIEFPLIEVNTDFTFPYLAFETLKNKIDIPLNNTQKDLVKASGWRLDLPLLIAYAARKNGVVFSNKKQFLLDIGKALNTIDGSNDLFIGKQLAYAFKENVNIIKTNFLYQFPLSLQSEGTYPKIFYPQQFLLKDQELKKVIVNYVYIDVLRAANINIGDGTWSCEFNLDIVSPHQNSIDIINFNNLSSVNPKFNAKPIWEDRVEGEDEYSSRYYVVANFDFNPIADNYPFDLQHIFISFTIIDQNKYGIISPIPEALIDKDFQVDGWDLNKSTTGVLRQKEIIYQGADLKKTIEIKEEARVGWTLMRTNTVTLMKIGIPLSFLLFLNYYTLFIDFKNVANSIGILTTVFLSGIALYFSTERPQPLRMTTVDLIFLSFYVLTGTTIVAAATASMFGENVFLTTLLGLKFALPLSMLGICLLIMRRIKSIRKIPRLS